jgi:hypothetical protein
VRFGYTKASSTLSADALSAGLVPNEQAAPVPETVAPQADNTPLLIAGGVVLALGLGAASYAALAHSRRTAAPVRGSRRAAVTTGQPPKAGFCTQCGQGVLAGDRFCRNCGTRTALS